MRYMIILEDGSIVALKELSPDIFQSFEDGLVDIIDCEDRTIYIGEGDWVVPEKA